MAGVNCAPELGVDMLDGVNAEAVNVVVADPALVDVDHPLHHFGVFGEEVVQPKEVAVERIFAGKL